MGTRVRHEDLPLPLGLRARALLTEPNDLTSCQCAFSRLQPDGHLMAPPASGKPTPDDVVKDLLAEACVRPPG
jgi:hypothetical protein